MTIEAVKQLVTCSECEPGVHLQSSLESKTPHPAEVFVVKRACAEVKHISSLLLRETHGNVWIESIVWVMELLQTIQRCIDRVYVVSRRILVIFESVGGCSSRKILVHAVRIERINVDIEELSMIIGCFLLNLKGLGYPSEIRKPVDIVQLYRTDRDKRNKWREEELFPQSEGCGGEGR